MKTRHEAIKGAGCFYFETKIYLCIICKVRATDLSNFSGLSTLKKWTLRAGNSIFLYGQKKLKVKYIVLQSINEHM